MLNRFALQGRLVRDIELRHTNSGTAVASFTVAWSEKYKDQERQLFMPCVAWKTNAENASRFFHKGQEIVVEGQLTSRKWQDKDGTNRETIELTVDRLHFCGPKKDSGDSGSNYGSAPAPAYGAPAQNYGGYGGQDFAEIGEDPGELPF